MAVPLYHEAAGEPSLRSTVAAFVLLGGPSTGEIILTRTLRHMLGAYVINEVFRLELVDLLSGKRTDCRI